MGLELLFPLKIQYPFVISDQNVESAIYIVDHNEKQRDFEENDDVSTISIDNTKSGIVIQVIQPSPSHTIRSSDESLCECVFDESDHEKKLDSRLSLNVNHLNHLNSEQQTLGDVYGNDVIVSQSSRRGSVTSWSNYNSI